MGMSGIARGPVLRMAKSLARPAASGPVHSGFEVAERVKRPGLRSTDTSEATVARLLDLPLGAFGEAAQILEIRVPWDPGPLWFVPTPGDAEMLVAEGINLGRIWTAANLAQLLAAGVTKAEAQRVARTRIAFEADVVEIRPRWAEGSSSQPTQTQLTMEGL
jgi:hypothetical protein